ncbi:MAG TPA: hypothetical protein VHT28_14235, partial [Silvibacterium sp.]|nr:hypothetical protein [Silvibacterium sp.]
GLPVEARDQMIANQSRLHDTPIPAGLTQEQQIEAAALLDRAFLSGFRLVMLACATAAWLGALSVLMMLRKRVVLGQQRSSA